ncbi:MAG TPA: alpha/beta hydrolase [Xanthomonadales bacterium]|nr:alpha/beta hydrolase [Xanthomonadales bacterium]
MSAFSVIVLLFIVLVIASWYLAAGFWSKILTFLSRWQAGLKSSEINIDGIHWHYLHGGKGPILILIHGFGADNNCWLPLAKKLGPRFSLLIPDLPGFGSSEPPNELKFDITSQTQRVMAFLDALGIETCLVAGNSMGGYVAASLAATVPDRVRAVWLIAPLGIGSVSPGKALEAIDAGTAVAGQVTSVKQFRQEIIEPLFSKNVWLPYPFLRDQALQAIKRKDEMPRMLNQIRFESETLEEIEERITQPVLVQWGAGDLILNPAGLEVSARLLPDCETHMTENCGHMPMFECPRLSAKIFFDWIDRKHLAD